MSLPARKHNQSGIIHHITLAALVFIVGVAMVGSYELVSSNAATAAYVFKSGITGKCLDDWRQSSSNGSVVDLFTCNTTSAQQWNINSNGTIENANGKCLDNWQAKSVNGNPIRIYTCSASDVAEQWKTTGNILENPKTSKCVEDPAATATNGTRLELYACNGNKDEVWTATKTATSSTGSGGSSKTSGGGSSKTTGGSATSTSGTPPTPASAISCTYRDNTWDPGDASSLDYTVTDLSSKDGNPASFSVKLNAKAGTTRVVAYPDAQCILTESIPANLTSSYNITPPTSPSSMDYEFAYDFWINTATAIKSSDPWGNNQEIMIWTYNHGQTPSGKVEATLSDGSKVWGAGTTTNGASTISIVLPENETSGTVDLASILSELRTKGLINSADTGIDDVEYGIEAPYGAGQTFTVNSFSVAD
jgi:hypothetical protein